MCIRRASLRFCLVCLLLTGCASAPEHWHDEVKDNITSSLEEARHTNGYNGMEIPHDISAALLPPMQFAMPDGSATPLEPRFDLAAHQTPARQVFMSLVENTHYSMVVHPNVDGKISLSLKDVTVPEAVEALHQVYGYDYKRDGNRFYVLGQGIQSRMYPVNYLNFNRRGRSDTRVSSGELTQSGGSNDQDNGSDSGSSSQQSNSIEVETTSVTDFWKELRNALEAIIGNEDGRRVVVHPQAGLVIARAMPAELDLVERYLGLAQSTVNRQVILEAKIIEVELKDSFQAGINWAALGGMGNTDFLLSQTGGGSALSSDVSELAGADGNLQPDANFTPIASGKISAFGGVFSAALKTADFAAFVELLKGQGKVHVLSSPRVSTVNNQKAVIKVGGDEFFVTGVSNSSTTTGASTTSVPTVELTPFFSGIALDVTPQIDQLNNITLHIHPTVSTVAQKDKNFIVSGESFTLPLAFSTIQESDNVVRASSGQIILIGGLMKEATTDQQASVPLLGDLPVLGNLFKHQKLTRIKKELVIMLKPTVVDHTQTWEENLDGVQTRTKQLLRIRAER